MKGQRALAMLRLLGLFDRPATADCLAALLKAPAIAGLTEPLVGLGEAHGTSPSPGWKPRSCSR